MASARPSQGGSRIDACMNLVRSSIGRRVRLLGARPPGQRWADGLSLFSVAAPVILLLATVLEVAVPYRLASHAGHPVLARFFGMHPEIGGLHLLSSGPFVIALACQAVIAVFALAGQRWLTLAALAGTVACWIANLYQVPDLLQVLSGGVFLLAGAALIASPGPRQGRQLLTWRCAIVLALCVAAIQVSTLMYDAAIPFARILSSHIELHRTVYFAVSVVLLAVAAVLTASFRLNRCFVLFLAVLFYPYVLQLVPRMSSISNLIGEPTLEHLTVLFLPALLLALTAILVAALQRRFQVLPSPEPGQPPAG
jgi:hypothetical protein